MARDKRLLIIECIPRSEKFNESLVLSSFLRMTEPDAIHTHAIRSKSQMLNYLGSKRDLQKFDFVHISAHGGEDTCLRESCVPKNFPRDASHARRSRCQHVA